LWDRAEAAFREEKKYIITILSAKRRFCPQSFIMLVIPNEVRNLLNINAMYKLEHLCIKGSTEAERGDAAGFEEMPEKFK
jgi:hypothetical protein